MSKIKLNIVAKPELFDRWVLGGDSSLQASTKFEHLVYAIVAFQQDQIPELEGRILDFISSKIGNRNKAELHVKDIWNGSTRMRTPFATLANKDQMKDFFYEIAGVIAQFKPIIVANCLATEIGKMKLKSDDNISNKGLAAYATLSRVDINVFQLTKTRIGGSPFYIDREADRMMRFDPQTNQLSGLITEVEFNGYSNDEPTFTYRMNPRYIPVNSEDSIIVQISDLAAYFVGKHLTLFDKILSELNATNLVTPLVYKSIEDCNYSLQLLKILDIEVVSHFTHQKLTPEWLTRAVKSYNGMVPQLDGAAINISIRESILASKNGKEFLNGAGYISLLFPRDSAEQRTSI